MAYPTNKKYKRNCGNTLPEIVKAIRKIKSPQLPHLDYTKY